MNKIVYEVPSLENQVSLFNYFLNLPNGFQQKIYSEYPNLATENLEDFTSKLYSEKQNELNTIKNTAQAQWNNIEDEILKIFSEILDKNWNNIPVHGDISLVPISTRDLEKREFTVFFKKNIHHILKTTTHEIFHFIYFDKWNDIFPNAKLEECDYPSPIWALSEIALPIMLNNTKIPEILGIPFDNYSMFENKIFNGENITEHIQNLYIENSLEDFFKDGKEYIEEYFKFTL